MRAAHHRWQQTKFEPSLFTGAALTLPLFRGLDGNDRVSFDLTLSLGWELDLMRDPSVRKVWEPFKDDKNKTRYRLTDPWKADFRTRNHFVVAIGLNVFALFSPKTSSK